jgi:hypothetical protein
MVSIDHHCAIVSNDGIREEHAAGAGVYIVAQRFTTEVTAEAAISYCYGIWGRRSDWE